MYDSDRRVSARRLQRFLVRFDDAGEMRMAFTQNISETGMFLKTRYPPPPGADLRLLIRTARGTEEHAGTVVWSRLNLLAPDHPRQASGVGVRFEQSHSASGARLEA